MVQSSKKKDSKILLLRILSVVSALVFCEFLLLALFKLHNIIFYIKSLNDNSSLLALFVFFDLVLLLFYELYKKRKSIFLEREYKSLSLMRLFNKDSIMSLCLKFIIAHLLMSCAFLYFCIYYKLADIPALLLLSLFISLCSIFFLFSFICKRIKSFHNFEFILEYVTNIFARDVKRKVKVKLDDNIEVVAEILLNKSRFSANEHKVSKQRLESVIMHLHNMYKMSFQHKDESFSNKPLLKITRVISTIFNELVEQDIGNVDAENRDDFILIFINELEQILYFTSLEENRKLLDKEVIEYILESISYIVINQNDYAEGSKILYRSNYEWYFNALSKANVSDEYIHLLNDALLRILKTLILSKPEIVELFIDDNVELKYLVRESQLEFMNNIYLSLTNFSLENEKYKLLKNILEYPLLKFSDNNSMKISTIEKYFYIWEGQKEIFDIEKLSNIIMLNIVFYIELNHKVLTYNNVLKDGNLVKILDNISYSLPKLNFAISEEQKSSFEKSFKELCDNDYLFSVLNIPQEIRGVILKIFSKDV